MQARAISPSNNCIGRNTKRKQSYPLILYMDDFEEPNTLYGKIYLITNCTVLHCFRFCSTVSVAYVGRRTDCYRFLRRQLHLCNGLSLFLERTFLSLSFIDKFFFILSNHVKFQHICIFVTRNQFHKQRFLTKIAYRK